MSTRPGRLAQVLRLFAPVALICLGGCARSSKPPAHVAPAPRPLRLAWLPVERLVAPEVAQAINDSLGHASPPGSTESYKAPVSMEVAQLAIECIEPVAACYAAVGRSLGADRLLWAELHAGAAPEGTLQVTLTLLDVRGSAIIQRAERSFASAQEARDGAGPLVDQALRGGGPR
jgi:hypothetical protein